MDAEEREIMEDLEKKLKEKFCTEGTFYWLWKETHSVDDVCKFIKENYQSKSIPMQAGVKPANGGQLSIRIFRDDNLQGFAAYHAQDESETKTILMNVYATFAASVENDIDAKEFIIQNLMHEFGHALEEYYQKEFDEDFIEKAVQSYFDKYHPDSRLSV